MAVNLEWDALHELITPQGAMVWNGAVGGLLDSGKGALFLLKPNPYKIVPAKLRPVTDSISQADGSSLQPPYVDGLVGSFYMEFWVQNDPNESSDQSPACGADLRQMGELLTLHLNALRSYSADPGDQQRLLWQPTGYGDARLIDSLLLAAWEDPEPFDASGGSGMSVTFELATPFPYAIDATEIDTTIAGGSSGTITNAGNAAQSMVTRTHGPTSAFVIENLDTGELLSYSGAAIGGGDYAEIDWFRGTIFLNGSGANLIAGLDPAATDFWTLRPGVNNIAVTGGDTDFLSNAAWL